MRADSLDPQQLDDNPQLARIRARLESKLAQLGGPVPLSETPEPSPAAAAAQARIPRAYRAAVADDPRVITWVRDVAGLAVAPNLSARPQIKYGPSLLLIGRTGRGKTWQAYGAIRSLLARGIDVRWEATTAADLYADMRPSSGLDAEWMLRRLMRTPLLLLDDLGAAKTTEWTEELTYRLINQRGIHQLPTLITSNLRVSDLRDKLGDRVASRITGMVSQQLAFKGPDLRRVAA
ncbi:ATP-binding protein [Streptomyces nigrescens]|uniref:ATP-binding protein n=1 Tax=Streptomyces nigrescens TaxID=1920 RepID=UPI0036FED4CE